MKKSKAFTLVELLVVIGIISVLISILLPALQKARESAKRISCASQMRQMGFAIRYYCNDNQDVLPWGRWTIDPGYPLGNFAWGDISWDDLLAKYMNVTLSDGDMQGFSLYQTKLPRLRCPSDSRDEYYYGGAYGWWLTYAPVYAGNYYLPDKGYGAHGWCFYASTSGAYGTPVAPMKVKLTSIGTDTYLLVEFPSDNNYAGGGFALAVNPGQQKQFQPLLHKTGFNYLCADTHVDYLTPEQSAGNSLNMLAPTGGWTRYKGD